MHILFIHTTIDIVSPQFSFSVAVLSAMAKRHNHTTSLLSIRKAVDDGYIQKRVQEENPDVIALTSSTSQWRFIDHIGRLIKKFFNIPMLCGEIHPTVRPEQVIASSWVDALCIGEGEYAFIDYTDALEGKRAIETIDNLWVRVRRRIRRDKISKNPIRPATKNLGDLPIWDYDIFGAENLQSDNKYSFLGKPGFFPISLGRDCPYRCTFCTNDYLLEMYKAEKGPFVRRHSIEYIVQWIKILRSLYDVKGFEFFDEMISSDEKWIEQFCQWYAREVGLPYVTAMRVEHASQKIMKYLKDSGCFMVAMGVESGNENYRKIYLNRKMTNLQIIDAFQNAKQFGLETLAWNMLGLPFETAAMIRETIELNRLLQPDVIGFAVFEPLPKTKLRELCEREGLLTKRSVLIYSDQSILQQKTLTQGELSQCYREFKELARELTTETIDWD